MKTGPPRDDPPPPERVGPYRIEARLGAGGMGAVYRAWDERLDRQVAVKHVLPDVAGDAEIRERLRREARSVASLNHPAIVQIYDIMEKDEGDWIVMELVEGETLHRLTRTGRLGWKQAVRLAREVVEGLAEAHAKGIVHRDLKTENVMVNLAGHASAGRVKILDFGLAKRFRRPGGDDDISKHGFVVGTSRAMSPEQARGESVDHRSDLFSLGSLIYETVTGKPPFKSRSTTETLSRVCNHPHTPVRELDPEIPPELAELIDHLLEKSADRRPQSAAEVAARLREIAAKLPEIDRLPIDAAQTIAGRPASRGRVQVPTPPSSSSGDPTTGIFIRTLLVLDHRDVHRLARLYGDDRAYDLVARHDRLARDLLSAAGGVEVYKTDHFLLLFERPADAVGYALEYHEKVAALGGEAGPGLEARIGIHLSEVFLYENTREDVHRGARPLEVEGAAKLVAARVASVAAPGQTLLTQAAFKMARRSLAAAEGVELRWLPHGTYELDGVEPHVQIHEVAPRAMAPMPPPGDADHARRVREETESRLSATVTALGGRNVRLAAVAAVLAAVAAGFFLVQRGGHDSSGRPSVAVLGFRNLAGDNDSGWLSTALSEMLSIELAASGQLRLIPGESVARAKNDLELAATDTLAADTLARVGRNLDTDFVILGSYLFVGRPRIDRQLRFQLRLRDTRMGETRVLFSETGSEDDLFGLVSRAGAAVRQELEVEAATVAETASVRAALPASRQAAQLYSQGLEKLRGFDRLAARDLLTQAVALDPDFALAHAALAEVWRDLGFDREAAASAQRAYDLAEGLPREEHLWIEALHHTTSGDAARGLETYDVLWRFFPDAVDHGLRLAETQITAGQAAAATATLTSLRTLPPPRGDDPRIDLTAGRLAFWLSDFEAQLAAATRAADKATTLASPTLAAEARLLQGQALYYLRRLEEAVSALEEAELLFARVGDRGKAAAALRQIGLTHDYAGELARAEEVYAQALAIHRETGNRKATASTLSYLAYVLREKGDLAAAHATAEEALAMTRETGDRNGEANVLDTLAWVLIHLGRLSEAEEAARQEQALYREIGSVEVAWSYFYLGRIAFDRGDLDAATALYAEIPRLEGLERQSLVMAYRTHAAGDVLLARGDLDGAARSYAEALSLRTELGDREGLAESRVARLRLLTELGRVAEAVTEGRRAVALFAEEGRRDARVAAGTYLARALTAAGELAEARRVVEDGAAAAAASGDPRLRAAALIVGARVLFEAGDVAPALAEIEAAVEAAVGLGLPALELEARLSLAEIEIRGGGGTSVGASGRARLEAVASEAGRRGYGLIARKAARRLASEVPVR